MVSESSPSMGGATTFMALILQIYIIELESILSRFCAKSIIKYESQSFENNDVSTWKLLVVAYSTIWKGDEKTWNNIVETNQIAVLMKINNYWTQPSD